MYILSGKAGVNHHAFGGPLRHRLPVHRHHEAAAVRPFDLDHVARAVIVDRDDMAKVFPRGGGAWQADQVGMIIFALAERRQRRSEEHTSELQSLMRSSYA